MYHIIIILSFFIVDFVIKDILKLNSLAPRLIIRVLSLLRNSIIYRFMGISVL